MAANPCGSNSKHLEEWYTYTPAATATASPASPIFKDAFSEAKTKFAAILSKDPRKIDLINSFTSLDDVQNAVSQAMITYQSRHTHPKAQKWLQNLSSRVMFYADVVDVLIQQNPEFTSLVWGSMKFFLKAVVNHEKVITTIAKALSQIADCLPRVKLATILYPTERIQAAFVELNANILRFLVRAYDWYLEGPLKHILHSVTRPIELRYKDLLDRITECSSTIRLLAECSQQVEIRVIRGLAEQIVSAQGATEAHLSNICTSMSLLSTAMVNTNQQVSDLQFSSIMQSLSSMVIGDPSETLQSLMLNNRTPFRSFTPLISKRFWTSPKLKKWTSSPASEVCIVRGDFRSRQTLRSFCVELIKYLKKVQQPVLFALKVPQDAVDQGDVSVTETLRYLVRQALQLRQRFETEKSMSISSARFHGSLSDSEWFQVLGSVLSELDRGVHLILDLELLNRSTRCARQFQWLLAFQQLFQRLEKDFPRTRLKVLLVNYSPALPFAISEVEQNDFVVRAKTDPSTARQRKARSHKSNAPRNPFLAGR